MSGFGIFSFSLKRLFVCFVTFAVFSVLVVCDHWFLRARVFFSVLWCNGWVTDDEGICARCFKRWKMLQRQEFTLKSHTHFRTMILTLKPYNLIMWFCNEELAINILLRLIVQSVLLWAMNFVFKVRLFTFFFKKEMVNTCKYPISSNFVFWLIMERYLLLMIKSIEQFSVFLDKL